MTNPSKTKFLLISLAVSQSLLLLLLVSSCCQNSPPAQTAAAPTTTPAVEQATFVNPDDAVAALVRAVSQRDNTEMASILGPDGADLLNTGDDVADRMQADRFLKAYNEKHQLEFSQDKTSATLIVGNNDWPMPIPIVKTEDGNAWVFDTDAGMDEIINRRIGRNELDVIEVCKAISDAEVDYAQLDLPGKMEGEYARKFISDPGKKDGLYWPSEAGQPQSPLGEFAAEASAEGYSTQSTDKGPRPYHGYYYRILTSQGPNAPGGEVDYEVNGHLIGGFAIVAWPADYANSGIMTFLADYKGNVYQKDLGDDTDKIARDMKSFDPDSSWKKADTDENNLADKPQSPPQTAAGMNK